jgi:hypothetical protein
MAHSIRNIDRATHLKIVVLALLLATLAVGLTLAIHSNSKAGSVEKIAVLKARPPVTAANSSTAIVR